jgi:hypothetical protein
LALLPALPTMHQKIALEQELLALHMLTPSKQQRSTDLLR